ncbi:hypothetical protein DITRI_Ditri11bG0083600 [Diplodiscus trichospermus]
MEEFFEFLEERSQFYSMLGEAFNEEFESSCLPSVKRVLDAAFTGDLNLFKRLANELDAEGNLAEKIANSKDDEGRAALHVAAFGGRTRILKYLIDDLNLDINVTDDEGNTPLHCAIQRKHFPAASYLLDKGANMNSMNAEGLTVLHCAALQGPKKLLQLLIAKGATVDANTVAGTPLQRAAAEGKKDSVKVLLDNNANPNNISCHTFCPLVLSIINGSIECVMLLLKAGADPNHSTPREGTPLDIAVSKGDTQIVKCLLNAGADPNVTNESGLTPIEVAAILGNRDAVMYLFPVTSPISIFPDWSVDGIMANIHSKEVKEKRKQKLHQDFLPAKLKGTEAVNKMDYRDAIKWYTKAISCNDKDPAVFSNQSFCWARLNEGANALEDAKVCLMLKPNWPKAYYRVGMAWMLLKNFLNAADAFYGGWKLDLKNKELEHAFGEAIEAQRKLQA